MLSFGGFILLLGWVGVERIWYLRIFHAKRLDPGEAIRLVFKFIPRYLRLGVIIGLPLSVAGAILGAFFQPSRPRVWFAVSVLLLDVFLTFMTTALAFSTYKATEAISIGLRTIRRGWPGSVWYLLLPPLAVQLFVRTSSPGRGGHSDSSLFGA